jgi:hypothetical protein
LFLPTIINPLDELTVGATGGFVAPADVDQVGVNASSGPTRIKLERQTHTERRANLAVNLSPASMAQRYRWPWHASLEITNPSLDDYATVAGAEFSHRTFTVLIGLHPFSPEVTPRPSAVSIRSYDPNAPTLTKPASPFDDL